MKKITFIIALLLVGCGGTADDNTAPKQPLEGIYEACLTQEDNSRLVSMSISGQSIFIKTTTWGSPRCREGEETSSSPTTITIFTLEENKINYKHMNNPPSQDVFKIYPSELLFGEIFLKETLNASPPVIFKKL